MHSTVSEKPYEPNLLTPPFHVRQPTFPCHPLDNTDRFLPGDCFVRADPSHKGDTRVCVEQVTQRSAVPDGCSICCSAGATDKPGDGHGKLQRLQYIRTTTLR